MSQYPSLAAIIIKKDSNLAQGLKSLDFRCRRGFFLDYFGHLYAVEASNLRLLLYIQRLCFAFDSPALVKFGGIRFL